MQHLNPNGDEDPLSALVCIRLRHGAAQPHLKLVAAQRRVPVVADESVEAVEHQVVGQVEAGGTGLLPGVDPAVLDAAGAPGSGGTVGWEGGEI